MSKTTDSIRRINQELKKISDLDGIVTDKIEELEQQVKTMVSDILSNQTRVNVFDHDSYDKNVTPKETFELELRDGCKAKFVEGNVYNVNIRKGIHYVNDIPFDEKDFIESFTII